MSRALLRFVGTLLAFGCASEAPPQPSPRPGGFTRDVEARVHYGFPGAWSWELAYLPPESFRLSLRTTAAPQHYIYDGSALEVWLGDVRVSRDPRDGAAYASIGRWLGVSTLSALPAAPGRWEDAEALGPGVARVLSFRFSQQSEAYWLGFDDAGRVVAARGPIEIPGIGAGRLEARFGDFRRVGDRELPFAAYYHLDGQPFFDERVLELHEGARLAPSDTGSR